METNTSHNRSLLRQLIPAILPLAVLALVAVNLDIDPAEDAHIMFRYAHNLAGGYGLAWNPGDAPVEGATEFLWTLLLTGGIILGLDVGAFAQGAALLFAVFTVVAMYFAMRRLLGVRPLFAVGAAAVFAAGPVSVQALSGFGTPLFTFLMLCSWICLALLTHRDPVVRDRAARLLPILWLLLGLSRPEGVFFSVLEFFSALVLLGYAKDRDSTRDSRKPTIRGFLKYCLLFFVLPGLLYFLWRWQYFGWPLPNTFYAKHGDELIHWSGYPVIRDFFWQWTAMFVLFFLVLLRSAKWERLQVGALLMPAVVFPWLYMFIEQMQNIGLRFQYPVLPIYLLLFAILCERLVSRPVAVSKKTFLVLLGVSYIIFLVAWSAVLTEANLIKIDTSRAVAVTAVLAFFIIGSTDRIRRFRRPAQSLLYAIAVLLLAFDAHSVIKRMDHAVYDSRVQIGKALRPFADRGYTMLTTETGWLPYFSGWRSVDPFGLYDVHVAHHGLDENYMREIDPELIVFHVYSNRYRSDWVRNDPRWNAMTQKLFFFAEANNYTLAARVGWPHDCFWYYVKKSCPDAPRIVSVIANQEGVHYTVPDE